MHKTLIAILLLAVLSVEAHSAGKYKLSMLPRYSSEEILSRITPLAKYLGEQLDETIDVVVTSDFKTYETRLKRGDIKIGYENPYIYALVSDQQEVLAMAAKGKQGSRFRGIIITRADSEIVEVSDLKGKRIAIVSKTAAGGLLSQQVTLQEHGLDTDTDVQFIEALDNKQENVILSVYYGDVDAGFIRESALHIAKMYVPPSQIKVIKRTAWLPNWALSVSRNLPEDAKRAIRSALLDLREDDPVLKALKINHFIEATDADYDIIRKAAGLPIPRRKKGK